MKPRLTPHKDWYLQGTDGNYFLYEELVKEPNIRLEVWYNHKSGDLSYLLFDDSEGFYTQHYRIYPNPLKELEVGQKVLILDTWEEWVVTRYETEYTSWSPYYEVLVDEALTYRDRENLIPLND